MSSREKQKEPIKRRKGRMRNDYPQISRFWVTEFIFRRGGTEGRKIETLATPGYWSMYDLSTNSENIGSRALFSYRRHLSYQTAIHLERNEKEKVLYRAL